MSMGPVFMLLASLLAQWASAQQQAIITLVGGNGTGCFDGDGGLATGASSAFWAPLNVAVSADGR